MQAFSLTFFLIVKVSFGVRIKNVFVFHTICVRLHTDFNTPTFGHYLLFPGK